MSERTRRSRDPGQNARFCPKRSTEGDRRSSDAAIAQAIRDRVLEVVKQSGYVPDATARVFASGRSGIVAVLVPSINNSNFADTTRGMSGAFERAGAEASARSD